MRLSQLSEDERPRERLFRHGAASLSVVELMAILLGTGTKDQDVLEFSASILSEWGGLAGLCRAEPSELMQKKGLKKAKTALLASVLELGRRIAQANREEEKKSWRHCAEDIAMKLRFLDREQICAVFLDSGENVIDEEVLSYGGQNGAFLDVPVFFRKAVRLNASSIVLIHNHPDGTRCASREDTALTEHVRRGLKLLGMDLKAHLIAAGGSLIQI